MNCGALTAEGLASLEGGRELRPHVHEHVLALLQLAPPLRHGLGDHCSDSVGVVGVEHVADPLLVEVVPVLLVGEEAQQRRLPAGVLEEVLDGEAVNLGHGRHLHRRPLDVLEGETAAHLPLCSHE